MKRSTPRMGRQWTEKWPVREKKLSEVLSLKLHNIETQKQILKAALVRDPECY